MGQQLAGERTTGREFLDQKSKGGTRGRGGHISKLPKWRAEGKITSGNGLQLRGRSALRSGCGGGESQSKLPALATPPMLAHFLLHTGALAHAWRPESVSVSVRLSYSCCTCKRYQSTQSTGTFEECAGEGVLHSVALRLSMRRGLHLPSH